MAYGSMPLHVESENEIPSKNVSHMKRIIAFVSSVVVLFYVITFSGNLSTSIFFASSDKTNYIKPISDSSIYTRDALTDHIEYLPGLTFDISFNQFSGYLNISSTKHVFYWFFESQNDPANDPLVFWTNGGPGCSGFIGLFGEHGPFTVGDDLTLSENVYSWNLKANMLYVEIPVGVGFSYSDDPETDYKCSDLTVANDNYKLILAFLDKFPQFRDSELYLTAESYGGHYLPSLAKVIVEKNELISSDSDSYVNFKGFMVGNPLTDPVENMKGLFETLWGHQLVSQGIYETWNSECNNGKVSSYYDDSACIKMEDKMWEMVGDLDPYALDYPLCTNAMLSERKKFFQFLTTQYIENFQTEPNKLQDLFKFKGYDACEDDYMTSYLNLDSVKTAINAKSDITWSECSDYIDYNYANEMFFAEEWYHFLINSGYDLRILIFSGDDDCVCGTIGTQYWLGNFGLSEIQPWTVWYENNQVAGYLVLYEKNVAFSTVHGAGHEVPAFKPKQALKLFQAYLDNDLASLTA